MAALALRDADAGTVADTVVRYAVEHRVAARALPADQRDADDRGDTADGWPARDGWTVVIWPNRFTGLQPAARWLAATYARS